nr:MAG TPA: Janus/Ocnus family (Ocnus) [Caudoviricetes sp.]
MSELSRWGIGCDCLGGGIVKIEKPEFVVETWKFKDEIFAPSQTTDIRISKPFISNGQKFSSMRLSGAADKTASGGWNMDIYYDDTAVQSIYSSYTWASSAWQTVEFLEALSSQETSLIEEYATKQIPDKSDN